MCKCLECSKEIASGDLCKFCKCFRKDSLVNYASNKRTQQMELSMSTEQVLARLKFMEIAVKEGGYSYDEVANMDLIELRDLVDELRPLMVVNSSVTMRGGKTRKVTVVRK